MAESTAAAATAGAASAVVTAPRAVRARTGGPSDPDGEHGPAVQAAGWLLVVLTAMLLTQLGLL
ncbi:SCO1431 family membrane protein [Streptomyces gamaensis]|uniref:SCO1431 family membrane protein n=1 Tax=Streptomyces gamaensis TaxID=1763542 RepID=A0ABW0YRB1_9ACTN